jgi:hypothetical protein
VSHIAKRYMTLTPLLSQGVFWEWVRPIDFYMVSGLQDLGQMLYIPSHCTHVWTIVPHVRGVLRVSHCQGILELRVSKAHELLHGIRASGPWTNVVHSLSLYTYLNNSATREGSIKSLTLPRYTWVASFISFEQTSSLKVPFVEE